MSDSFIRCFVGSLESGVRTVDSTRFSLERHVYQAKSLRQCWFTQLGIAGLLALVSFFVSCTGTAHEHTASKAQAVSGQSAGKVDVEAIDPEVPNDQRCRLTIDLQDDFTGESLAGLVRITNLDTKKVLALNEGIQRGEYWYALPAKATVVLPRVKIRLEAIRGLETVHTERALDLRQEEQASVEIALRKFYEARQRGWFSGNTHVHLRKMTQEEANEYLRVVAQADDLQMVFLSYLRRIPAEKDYISNAIVEELLREGGSRPLGDDDHILATGEEHRHNFGPGGEGYGHVMLLDLPELIRPVSIGPGIMGEGADEPPLQEAIQKARALKATVIWCHNTFGFEDHPSWLAGLMDAHNIFDGGSRGSYEDSFYRYLNIGIRIPFSTGTDWFIYDFARVYVPLFGELTPASWLAALRDGKSFITNGPFLELETERAHIGETLPLHGPATVTVVGRGFGRLDFGAVELVYNGKVVTRVKAKAEDGYYVADLRHGLDIDEPGWFALRVDSGQARNELGHPLFAHTSPVYVTFPNRELFRVIDARTLLEEMQASVKKIEEQGQFSGDAGKDRVLQVYRQAIERLAERIESAEANRKP